MMSWLNILTTMGSVMMLCIILYLNWRNVELLAAWHRLQRDYLEALERCTDLQRANVALLEGHAFWRWAFARVVRESGMPEPDIAAMRMEHKALSDPDAVFGAYAGPVRNGDET